LKPEHKKILKAVVLELRHLLEGRYDTSGRWHAGDLEQRLASLGVGRKREPVPVDELPHLSEADLKARKVVDAYLQLRDEAGISQSDAVAEYVRETAYTWANRLLCLRCMEARQLIDEVILQKEAYSGRSLEHYRLAQRQPELCAGEDDGLFAVLDKVFAERAESLPRLFDPKAPGVALRPSPAALRRAISLLSGSESVRGQEAATGEVFQAPDALGWAYQYYQLEEKQRVDELLKNQKGFKCEGSADIAAKTALYTESYMVKFLVQNSLGATWLGMHPESGLVEGWEYYVKDADRAPVEKKPLREITFLDPACGSGHFLLEAFDLYYDLYEEEGKLTVPEDICRSILENNLFGIDIDERAIQIAEAALWMKAAEKALDFKGAPTHLIATNIRLPKGKDHLKEFLKKHPEDKPLQPALEVIFQGLQYADELGSLLQIEEPVEHELRAIRERQEKECQQADLKGQMYFIEATSQPILPLHVKDWEDWRANVIKRIKKHFEQEAEPTDSAQSFFNLSANKGMILFSSLAKRYDIVAANPPYLGSQNMGSTVKSFVDKYYFEGKRDLFSCFIIRAKELSCNGGRVAFVTQYAWLVLKSYRLLRSNTELLDYRHPFLGLLHEMGFEVLAHLGPNAFSEISGEVVNVVLFCLKNEYPSHTSRLSADRFTSYNGPEAKSIALKERLANNGSLCFKVTQRSFLSISNSPIVFWINEQILDLLSRKSKLREDFLCKQGMSTTNNDRFLRYCWEGMNPRRWFPTVKGGGYAKWWGYNYFKVDWEWNGARLKAYPSSVLRNSAWYGNEGFSYSAMSGGCSSVRVMMKNTIPEHKGPCLYTARKHGLQIPYLGYLNTHLVSYLLRSLNMGMEFTTDSYELLPQLDGPSLSKYPEIECLVETKKSMLSLDILDPFFQPSKCQLKSLLSLIQVRQCQDLSNGSVLATFEAFNEKCWHEHFGLSLQATEEIMRVTGRPAGWWPLLEGYDDIPDHLLKCSTSLRQSMSSVIRYTNSVTRLATDEKTIQNLQILFERSFPNSFENELSANIQGETDNDDGRGAHIAVPAETLLDELSNRTKINPISLFWLLKEGIEKCGWRRRSDEQVIISDLITISVLLLLGHRWPKQIEVGQPVPEWADEDGLIPMTEGAGEGTLLERVRERIGEEFEGGEVASIEREFEEIMETPLARWLETVFFKHHASQFKRRPIAWQLHSGSFTGRRKPAFACLAYYHKMDQDALPKIRSQYTGPLRQRMETELRGIESTPPDRRSTRQESRRAELDELIKQIQDFDQTLAVVTEAGFGPEKLRKQLRQYAIDDATLCLKAQWLRRLAGVIQQGPLDGWMGKACDQNLHDELHLWIQDAFAHLDHHCSAVRPNPPKEKDLQEDPSSEDLAALICPHAKVMVKDSLKLACSHWWKRLDDAVFSPLKGQLKPIMARLKEIKEEKRTVTDHESHHQLDMEERELKRRQKGLQDELDEKTDLAKDLREEIKAWTCPEAETWEPWLAKQPMYDQISSLNEKRQPPTTVQEWIAQESLYAPDINDGVRVNIAPLQKAGVLAADVLAKEDVDKAISDRAEWRADERRWVREGKLPQPGWWKTSEETHS